MVKKNTTVHNTEVQMPPNVLLENSLEIHTCLEVKSFKAETKTQTVVR